LLSHELAVGKVVLKFVKIDGTTRLRIAALRVEVYHPATPQPS
jgi:hypothetical protein